MTMSPQLFIVDAYKKKNDLTKVDLGFSPHSFVLMDHDAMWKDIIKFSTGGALVLERRAAKTSPPLKPQFIDVRGRTASNCLGLLCLRGDDQFKHMYKVPLTYGIDLLMSWFQTFSTLQEEIGHHRFWFYYPSMPKYQTKTTHTLPPYLIFEQEADAVHAQMILSQVVYDGP